MVGVLVTAATGALKPVLEKLAALMGDKYKRLKAVRGDIRFLTDELAAMHAFLLVMSSEEDPNVQDKVWMTAVRELSYDMEDSIDDFMLSVDDKDTKPGGFIDNIKHSLGKMKSCGRIGNEIHDMKKQVVVVGERNQRYKVCDRSGRYQIDVAISSTRNATVDPRALTIFEHASEIVGIDEPKGELIKMLTKEDGHVSKKQHPRLVSIVGSGGMGKTTLANQVYQELKGQFECWAFISMSRNPDMMNILRTILSGVTSKPYADSEAGSIQLLISNIIDFLAEKRYFIVVDDIWDVDAWHVIRHAFPVRSYNSKIITTTRISDVAEACRTSFCGDIYYIRPLNMVNSRQLFHRRLFNSNEDSPSHLEKVSDQILLKCDGLPLAIIAISGLLANRDRTEDLWNQVKDSIGRALERDPGVKRMMYILSLSYFDLPPCLKSCLLYMSIFPEDTIIGRKSLIMRWIAEGFIHKEDRYTVHEIGERYFNELLNRSLIQPMSSNKYGEVKTCRVHDTILDFIISKSVEENFVTILGIPIISNRTQNKVVRRLSLQGVNQGKSTILTTSLVFSHVRSLNVSGLSMEIPSLQKYRHLRVLDLEVCWQLENHHLENIVMLCKLRYLNLRRTKISELPEKIGHLQYLEMLDLGESALQYLPESTNNLQKLTHLLVPEGFIFPSGIAKMQALETLELVSFLEQSSDFLRGLGQLKNMRNLSLNGRQIDYSKDAEEERGKALVSSLCMLGTQNLRSLLIINGSKLLQEPLCLPTLEKLITRRSLIPHVPKWMSSLVNLQQLSLEVDRVKQDDLCILGALPALLVLCLGGVIGYGERIRFSSEVGFQFLRFFILRASLGGENLMFVAGSMPKLGKLVVSTFYTVGGVSVYLGIENLPCLTTLTCVIEDFNDDIIEATKAAMEREASTHPNHPTLVFKQR